MPKYIVTIGLEVHAQLTTQSKMFCACPREFGAEPNTHTCPTCLGLPGALPVLNEAAIEKTILTGIKLGCTTPPIVKWDRKNYFYPDMPKNYQITQFDLPLCVGGGVHLGNLDYPKDAQTCIQNPDKVVKLTRIHLEEDVAKSTHHDKFTTIDFNRAGTPLMEIVSDPDIDSAEEAVAYLNSLRNTLIDIGVSDADMEKGNMRCDVNISLRPEGQLELGSKIELKNLNSMSAVRRAIKYEIERQTEALDKGEKLIQSTRRWDDDRGETSLMRTKEDAHDYRYLPDPDLIPLRTEEIRARMEILAEKIELRHEKGTRFIEEYNLSGYDANVLSSTGSLSGYFEESARARPDVSPKKIANWLINDYLGVLNSKISYIPTGLPDRIETPTSQSFNFYGSDNSQPNPTYQFPVSGEAFANFVYQVESGVISAAQGKIVLPEMIETNKSAIQIIDEKNLRQVSDTGALEVIVDQILAANPDKVAEVKGGNEKAMNWFTGQAMKASQGKANPKIVTDIVRKKVLG